MISKSWNTRFCRFTIKMESPHVSMHSSPSISLHDSPGGIQSLSSEQLNKQLYRENAELKVKIEFLEQSLRDAANGLLSNDILQLRKTMEQQQRTITEQNDLIEEAQHIIEGLTNERDALKEQLETRNSENTTLQKQLQQAQAVIEQMKKQTSEQSRVQLSSSPSPAVKPSPISSPIKPSPISSPVKPSPISSPVKPSSISSPIKPSSISSPIKPSSISSPIKPSPISSPVKPSPISSPVKPSPISSPIKPSPSPAEVRQEDKTRSDLIWFQQLCLIVLSEEERALSDEEKKRRILLWCSKAIGYGQREGYWNTVSAEVNALHRLVVGTSSSEGAINQLHRIEDHVRLMKSSDADESVLEVTQMEINAILQEWNPSWRVDVPMITESRQGIRQLFVSMKKYSTAMLNASKDRESLISLIGRLRKENEDLIAFGKEVMERNESLLKQPCNHCRELEEQYRNALAEITRRGNVIRAYEARQKSLLAEQFRSTRRF